MQKRILFIINEDSGVQLSDFSNSPDSDWEFVTFKKVNNALQEIGSAQVDAVVADQDLSEFTGLEILNRIVHEKPNIRTILLAKLDGGNASLNCVGTPHQLLAKPCGRKQLMAALERAFDQDAWVPSEAARKLTTRMTKLPSLPYLYFQVLRELRSPEPSLDSIGSIVSRDPAMSAKLLQLVNSVSLGLRMEVASPTEAIMHLGFNRTQSLLLLAHTCSFFEEIKDSRFSVEKLWQHSLRTGKYAQLIARAEKAPEQMEEAFTAGLLHDIGKLVLAANYPGLFQEAQKEARNSNSELDAERKFFETTHADVAACLLSTWSLPWPIVQAVAFHHAPNRFAHNRFCPLTAVHAANAIDQTMTGEKQKRSIDTAYLNKLSLLGQVPKWQKICRTESTN